MAEVLLPREGEVSLSVVREVSGAEEGADESLGPERGRGGRFVGALKVLMLESTRTDEAAFVVENVVAAEEEVLSAALRGADDHVMLAESSRLADALLEDVASAAVAVDEVPVVCVLPTEYRVSSISTLSLPSRRSAIRMLAFR